MTQSPKIEIKNLSKIFHYRIADVLKTDGGETSVTAKDKIALRDINLEIRSGETVGIIGRNGAGKSTLLSIIVGIASQSGGEVNISGKVTAVLTIGIGLREDLTGRDNIYLDGEIQGKSKAEMDEVIDKIIDFAELEDFIDKPVKTYSTGMKSRLAFSMLVEIEPEILIIDEALSAGDIFFAAKASKRINEICQKGKIVILVSHSMGAIDTMCNRCLWMEHGEIIMDDKPDVVTKAYLKKIREEDELTDISVKRVEVSNTYVNSGCKITSLKLKQFNSDYSQNIFYPHDSFVIDIEIEKHSDTNPDLIVSIERIDGIVIHHQIYKMDQLEKSGLNSSLLVQLTLQSLSLNKGYYQLKLELLEKEVITNYFVRLFEVKNSQIYSGGSPLLHYPAEITLVNEEKSKCSDSIELITE